MSDWRVDGRSFDLATRTGLSLEAVYWFCGSLGVPGHELPELGYVRGSIARKVLESVLEFMGGHFA